MLKVISWPLSSLQSISYSLSLKLIHGSGLMSWWALSNGNFVLNCAGSSRCFLRQKLQDGMRIPSQKISKKVPFVTLFWTDGVLLEVCNYCHMKQIGTKSSCSKLYKLDYLVWQTRPYGFVGTNGSQGHHRASMSCSSSSQVMYGWWRGMNHDNLGGCGGG
jgi:hypothetical protein